MIEPIRDSKWLTEVGATESAAHVLELISYALTDPDQWLDVVRTYGKPGLPMICPTSPLELSTTQGLQTIGMGFDWEEKPEHPEAVRVLLKTQGFTPPELIAAAVFGYERVGLEIPDNAAETLFLNASLDAISARARIAASQNEFLDSLVSGIGSHPNFRAFLTPAGRIAQTVEPTTEVIRHHPELLEAALEKIEHGGGGYFGKPQPSSYSKAVAMGLKKLLIEHSGLKQL